MSKAYMPAGLALLLFAAANSLSSPAQAEDIKGWVLDFDRAQEIFVLNDDQTYQIAAALVPADLRIGSTVNLTFRRSGAKMDDQTITRIEVLCDSFGASCPSPVDRRR